MNTQLIVRQDTNLAVLQVGGPVPVSTRTPTWRTIPTLLSTTPTWRWSS